MADNYLELLARYGNMMEKGMADPLFFSRQAPKAPKVTTPLKRAGYLPLQALGLGLDIAKSPVTGAAQVNRLQKSVLENLGSYLTTPSEGFLPVQQEAPAAESAIPPPAAEGKSDTPTTAAQDQALIEAIARQTQAGASGGGGKSTQSPSIQDLMASMGTSQMTQQEQPKEDVTDYSKAMLRAGVAMLQADGDIWDALGAGFGAYQDQLDQQEKSVEEKALEAQKMALERQKADAYTMQALSPYLLRDKDGSGKSDKPESFNKIVDAYSKPLTGLKNQIDILSTQLENTQDPVAAAATKLQLTKAQNDYAAMMNAQMSLFGLGGAATDPFAGLAASYKASKQQ